MPKSKIVFEVSSLLVAVKGWAAAAGTRGAWLPAHLLRLVDAIDELTEVPTLVDLILAASHCAQAQWQALSYESRRRLPTPRGCDIVVKGGAARVVWVSDNHTITVENNGDGYAVTIENDGGGVRRAVAAVRAMRLHDSDIALAWHYAEGVDLADLAAATSTTPRACWRALTAEVREYVDLLATKWRPAAIEDWATTVLEQRLTSGEVPAERLGVYPELLTSGPTEWYDEAELAYAAARALWLARTRATVAALEGE